MEKTGQNNKLHSFRSVIDKLELVSYILFCIVVFDCALTGSGRWLVIFGITPRIFCCIASFILCLPPLFINIKKHIKNPVLICFAAFLVWMSISALIGIKSGNNRSVLISDIKGFSYIMLVPVAVTSITSRKRLRLVCNTVLVSATIQALFVLLINFVSIIFQNDVIETVLLISNFGLGDVSIISPTICRIFTKSAPYMIIASIICLVRLSELKKINWYYVAVASVCLNAVLYSYTRSLLGSAGISLFASAAILMVVKPSMIKSVLKNGAVIVACFLVLVFSQEIAYQSNSFNFAVSRTFNTKIYQSFTSTLISNIKLHLSKDSYSELYKEKRADDESRQEAYLLITDSSDNIRAQTKADLMVIIRKSPIIGNGLGAVAKYRDDVDEYFYLDVLSRMGVIGLSLYLLPYLSVAVLFIKRIKNKNLNISDLGIWISLLAFWVATAFNPWMNAAIGISWYAAVSAIPTVPEEEAKEITESVS